MKTDMKWIFGIVVLFFFSCGKREGQVSLSEKSEMTFQMDSLVQESCVGENCAKLRLVWPVADGGENASKINEGIQAQLRRLAQYGEASSSRPLDSLANDFLASFTAFKSEFPDSYGGWEIQAEGSVSYQSANTLSVYFAQFSFLGGAHPNSLVSFSNFDAVTGEELERNQLILDESKLINLAEKKFREHHKVEEGTGLTEDGRFSLPETGFFLANAMGFREGKFWIVYVPYEIGPYVLGYTELEFTKEELGDAVRW